MNVFQSHGKLHYRCDCKNSVWIGTLDALKEKDSTFVKMATRITTFSPFLMTVICKCGIF